MTVRANMRFVKRLNADYKIVLVSASPRRKQILELVGIEFDVWPSSVDESVNSHQPDKVCTGLSRQKALDVASQIVKYNESHRELVTPTDIIVIGSDTIVTKCDIILGKPRDEADAFQMLKQLSGSTHSVYTGVTLAFISSDGRVGEHTFHEETKVSFYPLSDDDIREYVATEDVMDKAGAYGIQTGAAAFIRSIEGDYYNVMGLPIARLVQELKELLY